MKKIGIFFLFCFIIISCNKKENPNTLNDNSDFIKIGTFNMEWLGDGNNDRKDRTEEDYQLFAKIISAQNADIIGLQEIENENALKRITKYLNDYDFFIGQGGNQQNLAILFKKYIKIKLIGEYTNLAVEYRRTRPGLMFEARKNNFDFIGMVVHLKSTSRYDFAEEGKYEKSVEIRTRQNEVLSNWTDSLLALKQENDLIIFGDFNDTPIRKKNNTMEKLKNNNNLIFLTESMKSCKYKSAYTIDHILVTQSAFKRYIKGSESMIDLSTYAQAEQLKQLSDHCPIFINFEIKTTDNDNSNIAFE